MDWDIRGIVSVSATVTNILMFLSGLQMIWRIIQRKTTQGLTVLPFMSCLVSCTLWAKYGILTNDNILIFVNITGLVIEATYTFIFYTYTANKTKILPTITWLFAFMFSMLAYTKYWTTEPDIAIQHHGIICASFNIFNYAAPLSAAASVIRKKSTENISFLLSLVYFIVALEWYFYGYLHSDYFIEVPNFIGIILGAFQLGLFVVYPSSNKRTLIKSHSSDDEK